MNHPTSFHQTVESWLALSQAERDASAMGTATPRPLDIRITGDDRSGYATSDGISTVSGFDSPSAAFAYGMSRAGR